jgi:hypothetical protein
MADEQVHPKKFFLVALKSVADRAPRILRVDSWPSAKPPDVELPPDQVNVAIHGWKAGRLALLKNALTPGFVGAYQTMSNLLTDVQYRRCQAGAWRAYDGFVELWLNGTAYPLGEIQHAVFRAMCGSCRDWTAFYAVALASAERARDRGEPAN